MNIRSSPLAVCSYEIEVIEAMSGNTIGYSFYERPASVGEYPIVSTLSN